MIELAALWKNRSKDGKTYLAGNLGRGARLLIFENQNKREGSKDPDYRLMVVENRTRDGSEPEQPGPDPGAAPAYDSDVPF